MSNLLSKREIWIQSKPCTIPLDMTNQYREIKILYIRPSYLIIDDYTTNIFSAICQNIFTITRLAQILLLDSALYDVHSLGEFQIGLFFAAENLLSTQLLNSHPWVETPITVQVTLVLFLWYLTCLPILAIVHIGRAKFEHQENFIRPINQSYAPIP